MKISHRCRLCLTPHSSFVGTHRVLCKYDVHYFHCSVCDLLQTQDPYWLEEAYCEALSALDTGLLFRADELKVFLTALLPLLGPDLTEQSQKNIFETQILDYGGGYGNLARSMRDIGWNFFWKDKFCKNIFMKYFEYDPKIIYPIVTCFEVFEHLNALHTAIPLIFEETHCQTLIFQTTLYQHPIPDKTWYYYSFESGQHISFYSLKTLQYIAHQWKFNLYSDQKNFHILTQYEFHNDLLQSIIRNPFVLYNKHKQHLTPKFENDHLLVKRELRERRNDQ